jgi:uncharacterized protein YndB with AHSA1/START domain
MNDLAIQHAYGELIEPATLKLDRVLPGPIERVWSYLTQSDLRRQWLAAGDMQLKAGATFEFVWRNDELMHPCGQRPAEFGAEQRMQSRITEIDPPRKLCFTWAGSGDVSIELKPQGQKVLMTVIHRRLPDRNMLIMVSAGWHTHLDVMAARLSNQAPAPFWTSFVSLREQYDQLFSVESSIK